MAINKTMKTSISPNKLSSKPKKLNIKKNGMDKTIGGIILWEIKKKVKLLGKILSQFVANNY